MMSVITQEAKDAPSEFSCQACAPEVRQNTRQQEIGERHIGPRHGSLTCLRTAALCQGCLLGFVATGEDHQRTGAGVRSERQLVVKVRFMVVVIEQIRLRLIDVLSVTA